MPESIVLVVSVADDVEAANMLTPDPLKPNQSLDSVDRGGSDVSVTHSHKIVGKLSMRDKVKDILFELEIHCLLARLKSASPGSGRMIVEEARKSKKGSATRKASTTT
ncbi:Gibberellin 2-beta-dioxygenase 8 [Hordeum vulgare]|nr:Gibberellin 2-beta-dioxygenase 8 [Hordeum vulgare]